MISSGRKMIYIYINNYADPAGSWRNGAQILREVVSFRFPGGVGVGDF